MSTIEDESRPLLAEGCAAKRKTPTPLPKLQIAILMLLHLSEPITSHCIFPFINQVRRGTRLCYCSCVLINLRTVDK